VMTTYITVANVQAQLNASGPDADNNYTVFGLPVSQASFQAHVDFANLYINSIIGADLTSDNPRYSWARMAAFNLASLRVLVAASGGMLLGAFDYRLGDLYITKASITRVAFEGAAQSFRNDLLRVMVNFSSPVKTAEASAADEVPQYRGGLINP